MDVTGRFDNRGMKEERGLRLCIRHKSAGETVVTGNGVCDRTP